MAPTIDLPRVFSRCVGLFDPAKTGFYEGIGSMTIWQLVFVSMHRALTSASPEEVAVFVAAIRRALHAPGTRLNDQDRTALENALFSAFDGVPRPIEPTLTPSALFLNSVTFER